jgi:hypothetical protein
MENTQKESPESNTPIVKQIIAQYSELWADVMYNRRLQIHLKKIEKDIQYTQDLMTAAPKKGNSGQRLKTVQHDLILLRDIIKKKLPSGSSVKHIVVTNLMIALIIT